MKEYNRGLKRLIWRHLGKNAAIPDEFKDLFQGISETLDGHDKDYTLLNRIMDLSSEELFSANAELRKRNEELDRFVYSTSHDLRAPLASIMGLLELIELAQSSEQKDKYLNNIKNSTNQLDAFIQEIIAYSQNKKIGVNSYQIDFKEVVNKSIKKLEFMHIHNSIETSVDIQMESPFYSDPQRIDNIISNLISNSIKYYDPKKENPFIKVTIREIEGGAVLQIEDNGIGIDKPHEEKIFDMFYRASSTSIGSGIGLYIVKEIVDKLGGKISVESEVSVGSKFELTIPNQLSSELAYE